MRIEQIEQLIEIVECGSIGKAAQKLYVQQPNLSMLVKNIEDEFHQPILPHAQRRPAYAFRKGFYGLCRAIL